MNTIADDPAALFASIKKNNGLVEHSMRTDLKQALAGNDPLLIEVLHYALLTGGKRLRPVLAIISCRLCGRDDEQLYLLAAAFEYLHVATLIHDDVIDHAENRRGQQSVVRKFGLAAAILAGDWLHARSMHLIGSLAGQQGLDVFCRATTAMVDGEFLQLRYLADPAVSEEQYFSVILRKTARLISSTCEIGALFAQGSAEQVAALAEYGKRIGIAFQIIDDLLDYLGDEEATGKKVGNDFIEGKLTLPLIHALANAPDGDRPALRLAIQGDRQKAEAYSMAKQQMQAAGSYEFSSRRAALEARQGVAALACFDRSQHGESLEILEGLAQYILRRDH